MLVVVRQVRIEEVCVGKNGEMAGTEFQLTQIIPSHSPSLNVP